MGRISSRNRRPVTYVTRNPEGQSSQTQDPNQPTTSKQGQEQSTTSKKVGAVPLPAIRKELTAHNPEQSVALPTQPEETVKNEVTGAREETAIEGDVKNTSAPSSMVLNESAVVEESSHELFKPSDKHDKSSDPARASDEKSKEGSARGEGTIPMKAETVLGTSETMQDVESDPVNRNGSPLVERDVTSAEIAASEQQDVNLMGHVREMEQRLVSEIMTCVHAEISELVANFDDCVSLSAVKDYVRSNTIKADAETCEDCLESSCTSAQSCENSLNAIKLPIACNEGCKRLQVPLIHGCETKVQEIYVSTDHTTNTLSTPDISENHDSAIPQRRNRYSSTPISTPISTPSCVQPYDQTQLRKNKDGTLQRDALVAELKDQTAASTPKQDLTLSITDRLESPEMCDTMSPIVLQSTTAGEQDESSLKAMLKMAGKAASPHAGLFHSSNETGSFSCNEFLIPSESAATGTSAESCLNEDTSFAQEYDSYDLTGPHSTIDIRNQGFVASSALDDDSTDFTVRIAQEDLLKLSEEMRGSSSKTAEFLPTSEAADVAEKTESSCNQLRINPNVALSTTTEEEVTGKTLLLSLISDKTPESSSLATLDEITENIASRKASQNVSAPSPAVQDVLKKETPPASPTKYENSVMSGGTSQESFARHKNSVVVEASVASTSPTEEVVVTPSPKEIFADDSPVIKASLHGSLVNHQEHRVIRTEKEGPGKNDYFVAPTVSPQESPIKNRETNVTELPLPKTSAKNENTLTIKKYPHASPAVTSNVDYSSPECSSDKVDDSNENLVPCCPPPFRDASVESAESNRASEHEVSKKSAPCVGTQNGAAATLRPLTTVKLRMTIVPVPSGSVVESGDTRMIYDDKVKKSSPPASFLEDDGLDPETVPEDIEDPSIIQAPLPEITAKNEKDNTEKSLLIGVCAQKSIAMKPECVRNKSSPSRTAVNEAIVKETSLPASPVAVIEEVAVTEKFAAESPAKTIEVTVNGGSAPPSQAQKEKCDAILVSGPLNLEMAPDVTKSSTEPHSFTMEEITRLSPSVEPLPAMEGNEVNKNSYVVVRSYLTDFIGNLSPILDPLHPEHDEQSDSFVESSDEFSAELSLSDDEHGFNEGLEAPIHSGERSNHNGGSYIDSVKRTLSRLHSSFENLLGRISPRNRASYDSSENEIEPADTEHASSKRDGHSLDSSFSDAVGDTEPNDRALHDTPKEETSSGTSVTNLSLKGAAGSSNVDNIANSTSVNDVGDLADYQGKEDFRKTMDALADRVRRLESKFSDLTSSESRIVPGRICDSLGSRVSDDHVLDPEDPPKNVSTIVGIWDSSSDTDQTHSSGDETRCRFHQKGFVRSAQRSVSFSEKVVLLDDKVDINLHEADPGRPKHAQTPFRPSPSVASAVTHLNTEVTAVETPELELPNKALRPVRSRPPTPSPTKACSSMRSKLVRVVPSNGHSISPILMRDDSTHVPISSEKVVALVRVEDLD